MDYNEPNQSDVNSNYSDNYRSVVHAMFREPSFAARAVGALLDAGVDAKDLSVMTQNESVDWGHQHHDDHEREGHDVVKQATEGITVTTPQDAGVGAVKGTGVGLGVGALAAIAAVTLPGVGIILGGGALAAALGATLAAGGAGALAGATYGYLKDQGVEDDVAKTVEADFQQGGALVSVTVPTGSVSIDLVQQTLAKYQDQYYMVGKDYDNDRRNDIADSPVGLPNQQYMK